MTNCTDVTTSSLDQPRNVQFYLLPRDVDAARLDACLAACEGISTAALERGAITQLVRETREAKAILGKMLTMMVLPGEAEDAIASVLGVLGFVLATFEGK